MRSRTVALVFCVSLAGCKASVQAKASTEGSANAKAEGEIADFDKPLDSPAEANRAAAEAEEGPQETPLLGARQDLTLKGSGAASCKCLAVKVGQPFDAAFRWSGEPPRTNRDSQLVVALSSSGQSCPEAGGKGLGASYWGYEIAGNDVVVVVENAAPGRPVAPGGIIPKPLSGGQVYVRPADKNVVYGRPVSGAGNRCPVGGATPASATAPASGGTGGVHIKGPESDPQSPTIELPP